MVSNAGNAGAGGEEMEELNSSWDFWEDRALDSC